MSVGAKTTLSLGNGGTNEEAVGIITTFPDELMLLIFQYLRNDEILSTVANVCEQWRKLSSDPALWRNRLITYNILKNDIFVKMIRYSNTQIKYLHLGGHETMEESVCQSLLSAEVSNVRKLDFLCSCRTAPSTVVAILKKFSMHVESLTLCLNDELVSFGGDGQTCYARTNHNLRPGILLSLLGQMENLKHLRLFGGFSTKWYFGELTQLPGCSKIEILDLKDFSEFPEKLKWQQKPSFIQTLILKNKSHLKSIKLSMTCAANVRIKRCVLECRKSLQEILIDVSEMVGLVENLKSLTSLHVTGRSIAGQENQFGLSELVKFKEILHTVSEISLSQFSWLSSNDLYQMLEPCSSLKVLRLEGSIVSGADITTILNVFPLLEKLYLCNTDLVAERHLISMNLHVFPLENIEFDNVFELDCRHTSLKLKHIPLSNLKVIQTGCDCKLQPCDGYFAMQPEENDSLPPITDNSSPIQTLTNSFQLSKLNRDLRLVLLILSNNLDQEYFTEFSEFNESDITFYFCQ